MALCISLHFNEMIEMKINVDSSITPKYLILQAWLVILAISTPWKHQKVSAFSNTSVSSLVAA